MQPRRNLSELGYAGYSVDENGNVFSHYKKTGQYSYSIIEAEIKRVKPSIDRHGRQVISLYKNGKRQNFRNYQLVAFVFIGPQPPNTVVCHNDGNVNNNHFSNLRYDTQKNNLADMDKHGTRNAPNGENHPRSKLTWKIVNSMRQDFENGLSIPEIAKKYKLHYETTRQIIRNQRWKDDKVQPRRNFNDPSYIKWRKSVYKRDNYTCKMCGSTKNLQAHHVRRWADNPHLRFDVKNGITLCVLCHDRVTGYESEYEDYLLTLLQRGNIKLKYDKFDIDRMLMNLDDE